MLRFGAFAFTLGLTAALAVVTIPSAAIAAADLGFSGCTSKPTKTDTADAKRSYERGKRLFDERRQPVPPRVSDATLSRNGGRDDIDGECGPKGGSSPLLSPTSVGVAGVF